MLSEVLPGGRGTARPLAIPRAVARSLREPPRLRREGSRDPTRGFGRRRGVRRQAGTVHDLLGEFHSSIEVQQRLECGRADPVMVVEPQALSRRRLCDESWRRASALSWALTGWIDLPKNFSGRSCATAPLSW